MDTRNRGGSSPILVLTAVALAMALAVIVVAWLLTDIFEKKQEGKNPFFRVVELDDNTSDPAIWGKNFPLQYDGYLRTVDMVRTKHGGSEAIYRDPTPEDPRAVTSFSKLDLVPQLKRMWAGYAFAKDFREERGHAYMLEDQIYTERQKVGQSGTCLHCHASTYVAMKELGEGDIHAGFHMLNTMKYDEARSHVAHAVACIDCHDSQSMALRVTRPAFMEGIKTLKAREGAENYDVNTDATRQEMRTYVCAQCHVEYYFKGEEKTLTYPWANGIRGDEILAYYEENGFKDWTHAETGAPMLKAQHPEFEVWSMGTHARAGVSCADCHMPYERVGAMKISDHHVRSPMLNVNNACQTCHKASEAELQERVYAIQDRHKEMVERSLRSLVELIDDLKAAKDQGMGEEKLKAAQQHQRKASFLIDFVEADNSAGFHAGHEEARLLTIALEEIRRGQLAVRE